MQTRHALLFSTALFAGACGQEDERAQLLVPEDVALHWDAQFNESGDGMGALVPVDLMVYEGHSGEAVSDVALEIGLADTGASIAFPDQVQLSQGGLWDAYRDQYFLFDPPEGPGQDQVLVTDENGVARAYIYVDAFQVTDGAFEPLQVLVNSGLAQDEFFLVPQ